MIWYVVCGYTNRPVVSNSFSVNLRTSSSNLTLALYCDTFEILSLIQSM